MIKSLRNDRGGVDIVKILAVIAVLGVGFFLWVRVPPVLDHMTIKKGVRAGCNAYYGRRTKEAVEAPIRNAFKEAAIMNAKVGVDGAVLETPMQIGNQLWRINFGKNDVSVTVTYTRTIVWPIFKKVTTLDYEYAHTEDLSAIEY